MPSQDRNWYSNKESGKVNAGLGFRGIESGDEQLDEAKSTSSTNAPAVNINFSQLIAPTVAPEPKPSTEDLARQLLHPPPHAFVHGVLSIQWLIGAVGQEHIKFRESDERYVLAANSQLRDRGARLGIPALYMEWLCGDNHEESAAEQSINLTPEFF